MFLLELSHAPDFKFAKSPLRLIPRGYRRLTVFDHNSVPMIKTSYYQLHPTPNAFINHPASTDSVSPLSPSFPILLPPPCSLLLSLPLSLSLVFCLFPFSVSSNKQSLLLSLLPLPLFSFSLLLQMHTVPPALTILPPSSLLLSPLSPLSRFSFPTPCPISPFCLSVVRIIIERYQGPYD